MDDTLCKFMFCFVYFVLYTGSSDMEVKREVDSNDVTECAHDDNPCIGKLLV